MRTGTAPVSGPSTTRRHEQGDQVEIIGARVEELLDRLAAADARTARLGEELVRTLVQMYGAGLERFVDAMQRAAPDALVELASDPLVGGLLSVHDLHPVGLRERIETALGDVRPYLGSHGGDVSVIAVDGDTVRLRLEGTCNGCGSSETTLEYAVEGAIHAVAPEIANIEVEGVAPAPPADGGLIPLESLLRCPTEVGGPW